MNFLVTGTNGFLGQHIIKFIKSLDGKILTIGRFNNKENSDTFLNIEDINKPVFNEVIKRFDPNYMFHIAGDAHPNNNKISDFVTLPSFPVPAIASNSFIETFSACAMFLTNGE